MSDLEFLKGMNQAPDFETGSYLPWCNAVYVGEVMRIHPKNTRKGYTAMIVDFEVVESSNPDVPVGSIKNWFLDMRRDNALRDLKHFTTAVTGDPNTDLEKALALAITDGAFNGFKFRIQTEAITTKERKIPFTKHIFSSYEE